MRIPRVLPGTVYVAALSIDLPRFAAGVQLRRAVGDGDAQRASFLVPPGAIEYHLDPSNPAFISGVSFDLGAEPRSVEAEIGDRSVRCRRLADDRWFCPAIAPVAGLESLRVTTGGAD